MRGAARWWKRACFGGARIVKQLAADPRRLPDLGRWLRDHRKTTLASRAPWWPYAAVDAVAEALPPHARVLEFGGGGSTLWLHDRGAAVVCVEHDSRWFDQLRKALPEDVELLLRPPDAEGTIRSEFEPGHFFDSYVAEAARHPDDTFDLVIVDGRARVECGLATMSKVRPGGMFLLDDSERPRYAPLVTALSPWPRTDFRGLKIGGGGLFQTTIWWRPAWFRRRPVVGREQMCTGERDGESGRSPLGPSSPARGHATQCPRVSGHPPACSALTLQPPLPDVLMAGARQP